MQLVDKADILICGCGIIGLTIANRLVKSGYSNIVIIEKEKAIGEHASGRNSGVLHAGIYYAPDSLKARFCLKGNTLMKEYCSTHGLPLLETGKAIVTKCEKELDTLKELYNRAVKNGAKVRLIDEKELREIEPYAKTFGNALYSYNTAVVSPKKILMSLYNGFTSKGQVNIFTNTAFTSLKQDNIAVTNHGDIRFDIFINAGGAYSDKIAHAFGIGTNYNLIPFKGIYKRLIKEKSFMVKGNIYPVPDIRNPFLGIHLTRDIDGDVYIGPTAIPAFGRENYTLLGGLSKEAFEIFYRDISLFFTNSGFRNIAFTEPKKYIFKYFFNDVKSLIKDICLTDIEGSNKVGIRPQLVNWQTKELVMDFVVKKDGNSIHILNAISPAFTSSMAFADFIFDEYIKNI